MAIHLVSLAESEKKGAPFTPETLAKLARVLASGGRTLIYYNRRGAAHACICRDCSHAFRCPRCDVALTYHAVPHPSLVCHHCEHRASVPERCPRCGGSSFAYVGTGTQAIEELLAKNFPKAAIIRLDADSPEGSVRKEKKDSREAIEREENPDGTIFVGTNRLALGMPPRIDLAVVTLLESELFLPQYDIEERVYTTVRLIDDRAGATIVQTRIPDHPLARLLAEWNYRDFFVATLENRKKFGYPPYSELVHLVVSDRGQERVRDLVRRLANKIELGKSPETTLFFDQTVMERRQDLYRQKIVLKGPELSRELEKIGYELWKNRAISVEWQ